MLHRSAIIAGTLAMLALAPPARGQTISGVFNPATPDEPEYATLDFTGPGVFEVGFEISRPADFGDFTINETYTFNDYDATTHAYIGGDDDFLAATTYLDTGITRFSRIWKVQRPYHIVFGNIEEFGFYHDDFLSLNAAFATPGPVSYTLFANRLGDVPEPAAWAVLILGFGLAGAALRPRMALRPAAPR
jgi:hypothetical protein